MFVTNMALGRPLHNPASIDNTFPNFIDDTFHRKKLYFSQNCGGVKCLFMFFAKAMWEWACRV